MKEIYVNLKRFDAPRSRGGLCPQADPLAWIAGVIDDSVRLGLADRPGLQLVYLLPEGLLPAARAALENHPAGQRAGLGLGCQGVHWDDIGPGKNFGAFTTALPATAAHNLGAHWAIIGHSEERRFKTQVIAAFEPGIQEQAALRGRAAAAVDALVGREVACAFAAGLDVLLCVGETAEERGEGTFAEQQPRIRQVLHAQLEAGLQALADKPAERRVVIGYEPVWAIGPGKTPPGGEYIAFVSAFIQETVQELFDCEVVVVYGGGLKQENAAMIAAIDTIGGGLVALTRFSGEIGFDVPGLKGIVDQYV